jgi:hypothetical protein
MKAIDFTQPGGFPLTQDQLDYLQQAYTECVHALGTIGGNGTAPYVISGMVITNPSPGNYTVTDGWFMYGGELVHIPAGGISGIPAGQDAYIQVTANASPLTFNNGSTPNVILDKSAGMVSLPSGTADDATHFAVSHLKPFGAGFGVNNREQVWQSLNVSTPAADGGVTGTIYYKKDFTANTLQIRGLLAANNAQNFAASPGALYYNMGTLFATYFPNNSTYFTAQYFVASLIQDDLGVSWIKQINCVINNTGQVLVNWIRPNTSIVGYGITFNATVPLD